MIRAKDVQVDKVFRARCHLGPWKGAEHPDYQGANAERQAHLDAHASGQPCKAPGPELTITQQVTIDMARELLVADRDGGSARVAGSESRPADAGHYAYGRAVACLGHLLEVVDELTAEPEAGQ